MQAKIIKLPLPDLPIEEAKSEKVADLDNGYTRIANDLYDALIFSDLTKNQQKVAHAFIRLTYGFNKKNDRIADIQIAEITNLPRNKVNMTKNELIAMNILVFDGRKIGINKNLSDWKIEKCYGNGTKFQKRNTSPKSVTKSVTETVLEVLPKAEHTKDIIPKTKNNNTSNSSDDEICDPVRKKIKTKNQRLDYQPILDAYNDVVLDGLPTVECLNKKRKSAIERLSKQLRNSETATFKAYFSRFMELIENKPFYFGGNNRNQWRATFDYVIRIDTLIKVREESL